MNRAIQAALSYTVGDLLRASRSIWALQCRGLSHRAETGKDEKTSQQKGQRQKKNGRKKEIDLFL